MADGVTITIEGTQEIDNLLMRLAGAGARKRDVTAVYRKAMAPVVKAGKAAAPLSSRPVIKTRLASRVHARGTLRRAIKFKTSRRQHNVWYVVPDRGANKKYDAWYAHFVGRGTVRGITANPFMDRAWAVAGKGTIKGIEDGLFALMEKIWKHGR